MDSRRVQFNSIFTLIYCILCATRDDVVVLSSACTRYCSCENYTILVSLVAFSTSKFLSFFLARNNIYFFLYALRCIVWIHGACTPIYLVFIVRHISSIGGRATHNGAMGSNREPFQHNGIWKSYFTKLLDTSTVRHVCCLQAVFSLVRIVFICERNEQVLTGTHEQATEYKFINFLWTRLRARKRERVRIIIIITLLCYILQLL